MEQNYRFTKSETDEQKMQLAFYILNYLTDFDVASIQASLEEIKKITGLDIDLKKAIQIKRLAALTSQEEQTRTATKTK